MNRNILILLAISLVLAGMVSWFASPEPDGLERVAIDSGFEDIAGDHQLTVMPNYEIPGLNRFLASPVAGILGTITVFVMVILLGKIITKRNHQQE